MSKITIRNSTIEDLHELTQVHIQCWRESYQGMLDQECLDTLSFEKWFEGKKRMLSEAKGCHLVALIGDKIVGLSDAGVYPKDLSEALRIQHKIKGGIHTLYILKDYKQWGIGTLFFQ